MAIPFVGEGIQIGTTVVCNMVLPNSPSQCNWVGFLAHEVGEPILEAIAVSVAKAMHYGAPISLDISVSAVGIFMVEIAPVAALSWFGSDVVAHDKNKWVKMVTGLAYGWLAAGGCG